MKKVLTLTFVLVLALSIFTSCKSSGAEGSGKSGGVSLNVVTSFTGNDGNTNSYLEAINAWQDETGNTVNDASAVSDETFKARIITDFETGAEPDVLMFFNGIDSNPFVEAGKVVSIDEIREEYPDYASNMKEAMLGASPFDGKNYSVPVMGYWEGMYVNKKVLSEAGVEIPGADYTWEQFLVDCQKIKDAGFAPIAASLSGVPHYWFEFTIYNHLTPATHAMLPKSIDDVNGKAWVNGVNDIKALYEAGYFPDNTLSSTDDETFQMFIDDKAAFLIDGSWKANAIANMFAAAEGEEPDAEKLANFTVTYVPGKNERKATDIIGGLSSGYYISRKAWEDPAKREAAVAFVTYMTSDAMVTKFAGTAATALKNGATPDESNLNSLQIESLKMLAGVTGIAPAVQDLIPTAARVPLFEVGMPKIVSGEVSAEDAVQQCLDLLAG
jgi:ABC-type sugar transport system, periplasmic component